MIMNFWKITKIRLKYNSYTCEHTNFYIYKYFRLLREWGLKSRVSIIKSLEKMALKINNTYKCWGIFRQIFILQSAIMWRDIHTQIQKLCNIYSKLNFKEYSFYTFPCLFRHNKLWNPKPENQRILSTSDRFNLNYNVDKVPFNSELHVWP